MTSPSFSLLGSMSPSIPPPPWIAFAATPTLAKIIHFSHRSTTSLAKLVNSREAKRNEAPHPSLDEKTRLLQTHCCLDGENSRRHPQK